MEAKLTSKGQITIPAEIRKAQKLDTGDKVVFVRLSDGTYRLVFKKNSAKSLFGKYVPPGGQRATLEDFDKAIADGASRKR